VSEEKNTAARRANRGRFLRHLYARSQADVATFHDGYEIADELRLPHDELGRIVRYYEERGLVKQVGGGGLTLRITAAGIDHVEAEHDDPGTDGRCGL
jgi:hypothetical protein